MERPRVLHLLNSRHFNGAENVAATLMSGLRERWDTLFVSRDGPVEEALRERGLPFRGVSSLRSAAIARVVRDFRPNLVHAHDYRASLVAATLDCPVVSHLHNNYPWARRLGPATLAYRWALPRFGRVIAVSPSVIEEHRFRRALAPKSVVIENGLDFDRIRLMARDGAPAVDLIFVGRLTEQKDPLAFIRIVKALQSPDRPVTAVMLGAGDLLPECERAVAELGLSEVLTLKGYVSNPYPDMAAAKLCVVPSQWEGFGLVALEALALGTLPLGRPVGGLARILRQISPDLVCDTEAEFVRSARTYLADEIRRRDLLCAHQNLVDDTYSQPRFAIRVEEVYREALMRR